MTTGDAAEIGRINELVSSVKATRTPLQAQISHFGFLVSIGCIGVVIIVFLVAKLAYELSTSKSFEVAISVAVALIPEGLPTVVTITLALGVQALARNNAIVRQLPAVETLGAVTCICSDKTGTLTKNEMTAVSMHTSGGSQSFQLTGTGYNPYGSVQQDGQPVTPAVGSALRELLLPAALCNDATMMPVISAEIAALLQKQPLNLPRVAGGTGGESATADAAIMGTDLQWYTTGDPTEAALVALVMKAGLNYGTVRALGSAMPRVAAIPFASEHKFMATVHTVPASELHPTPRRMLFVKGATDVLLPCCATQARGLDPWHSEPLQLEEWRAANARLAQSGSRVLALCQRELRDDEAIENISPAWVLAGPQALQLNALVAIVDPPREEVIDAIRSCHAAGVTVKMITGDHAETARTIGSWIGIQTSQVLTGAQLQLMDDAELERNVEACNIYARSSPEHKLRIVRALQKRRHIVAMTGDGVNDAPALRQANVGVAMGKAGTEVAREAARMVLQDDNFATIEAAVRMGRRTYDNLRKLIMFMLPTTVAQGFSVAVAVFIDVPAPLTQVQILFVNMVTAATLGLALAAEEPEPNVMERPPRQVDKQLVGKQITWRCIFVGGAMIASMLGQQAWTRDTGGSDDLGHTVAMNTLVFSQCLYLHNCRFLSRTALSWDGFTGNKWLSAMVLLNIAMQMLITYTPGLQSVWGTEGMNGYEWLRVFMFAIGIFLLVELEKKVGPFLARPCLLPAARFVGRLCDCCSKGHQDAAPQPYSAKDGNGSTGAGENVIDVPPAAVPPPAAAPPSSAQATDLDQMAAAAPAAEARIIISQV